MGLGLQHTTSPCGLGVVALAIGTVVREPTRREPQPSSAPRRTQSRAAAATAATAAWAAMAAWAAEMAREVAAGSGASRDGAVPAVATAVGTEEQASPSEE